jgi:hypothetical protein
MEVLQTQLFDHSLVSVSLSAFDELDELHDEAAETLRRGLEAITQFGARLESDSEYANPLPLAESSLGEMIDLAAVLRTRLQSPVAEVLQANPRPTWVDVRQALASVSGVTINALAQDSRNVTFDIELRSIASSNQPLVLGDAVADAGLAITADLPSLEFGTDLFWSLQLDVDRRQTVSPLEALTIRFNGVDASVRATDTLSFDAKFGLLGVTVEGTVELDATLSTAVGGGQPVTASQLVDVPIEELISPSSVGGIAIDLPVEGSLGDESFRGSLTVFRMAGRLFDRAFTG